MKRNYQQERVEFTEEQQKIVKGYQLLTQKPVLYVANIGEDDIGNTEDNEYVKMVREYAEKDNAEVVVICARIEEEISE